MRRCIAYAHGMYRYPGIPRNTTFATELRELKEYFQIPGLAVLVQQGDSVLYEDYFGYPDVEKEIKVGPTTQFPIASITKVFTGERYSNYWSRESSPWKILWMGI